MKKTQLLELFCNIKGTFVSFFSIMMFVALGVAIFLGLGWSAGAVRHATESHLQEGKFHDIEVSYPLGLTNEDVQAISEVPGVESVEPAYVSSATLHLASGRQTAILLSVTNDMDIATCVEGTMPSSAEEVAIDSLFAKNHGIHVGDTIVFDADSADPDGMEYLTRREFKVVGIVMHPAYLSANELTRGFATTGTGARSGSGMASLFVLMDQSAFDRTAFFNCYSNVYVRVAGVEGLLSNDDVYRTKVGEVSSGIEEVAKTRSAERYGELETLLSTEVDLMNSLFDICSNYVAEGGDLGQLLDVVQGVLGPAGTPEALEERLTTQEPTSEQIAEGYGAVISTLRENGVDEELLANLPDPDLVSKMLTSDMVKMAVGQLRTQVLGMRAALDAGEDPATAVKNARENASATLELLHRAEGMSWSVSDRSANLSLMTVAAYERVIENLRYTMASLFLVVGLLVCYSAVSRIVREQIVSIGTKKALGLRKGEITLSYLLYTAIAVVVGVIFGVLGGVIVVEGITNYAAESSFVYGAIPPYFSMTDTLVIGAVELLSIWAATLIACRSMLRKHAVELLRGPEPPKAVSRFYEKWGVWQRMPLYSQSIVNNFFNDKTRVFSTLVGVAGCTALVVTAMTIDLNVRDTFTRQFDAIVNYTSQIALDNSVVGAEESVMEVLDDYDIAYTVVSSKTMAATLPDSSTTAATVVVPFANMEGEQAKQFSELFHMLPTQSAPGAVDGQGNAVLGDEGAWLSEAMHANQGVNVGDTIALMGMDGKKAEVQVVGFYEFHLSNNYIVMSESVYAAAFGTEPVPNTILAQVSDDIEKELVSQVSKQPGYFSYTNDKHVEEGRFARYQSLTQTVVLVYLGLSALMAFVVLLNLNVMFIEEKKRDLIVLMINGYSQRDAKRYIYRDNIVLTFIGIILGILLGILIGYLAIVSIEFSTDSYVHTPNVWACLAGAASSAVLAVIVNIIALRRISNFSLTDINKM